MENNSFFNKIKDSFEQTFQEGLSYDLWNNLSNKLEEEGMFENNEVQEISEQHIEESFKTIHQQSAPNIWENIAAGIGNIPTDEELIRESFEETHHFEAPEEVWTSISEEISNIPSTESLIKDSFGEAFKAQAPAHLWQQISSEVNPTTSTESMVKDSFEENFSKQAPDYIWNAVRQQINIDNVWGRLAKVLDRWKLQARRRAIAQRITSIASLLLLMHACLPTFDYGTAVPASQQEQQSTPQPMAEQLEIDNESKDSGNSTENTNNERLPHYHQPITKQKFGSSTNDRIQSLGKTTLTLPSAATNKSKFQQPKNSFSQKYGKSTLQLPIISKVQPEEEVSNSSKNATSEGNVNELAENADHTTEPINNQETIVASEENPKENKPEEKTPSWVNSAVAQMLPVEDILSPVVEIQSPSASVPVQNNASKSKFELGTILEAGVGFLWSEETFAGWEENTLLSTSVSPFLQYGTSFNWNFNKRSAISSELFVHSQIRQQVAYYSSEGYYETRSDELDYLRFSLLYQHRLLSYQPNDRIEASFLMRLGGYGAYLKNQSAGNTRFRSMDAGLRFMLGHVHRWDRLSFEYGVGTNWGLCNILDGSFSLSSLQVNRSNLVNFGLHGSLRYSF